MLYLFLNCNIFAGGVHGCGCVCMVAGGGMRGCGGRGMCDCGGVCVVARGCACLGGMHGCAGVCVGYDEIRSMSGWYTPYWNAFFLKLKLHDTQAKDKTYILVCTHLHSQCAQQVQ